ncbi:AAA family ATPase [Aureimonas sp. AU40]|uniref:AAA family ATPase n=1 Tax=Aureimonas sp. AU40 TaxID=1637747 RepID=UPI000782FD3A|nr:AAA family ATPase [Aureimonas sp. AU40]
MKDKSKGRYVPKRYADASRPPAEMSMWDLMLAIYPYDKKVLASGLAGQRSVPLEGLLLGCPPAQGSLLVDWSLFAGELEQDYGPLVEPAIAAGLFGDVGSSMSVVNLSALQHAVGRDVVGPLDDRVDYWRALLGDAYSARELRDRNRGRNLIVSAALDGLVRHCQTGRRSDKGVWRPGLGMEIFLTSIWSAQHDLDEASKAAGLVVDWSAHHRERDHKAGVEVGLQAADDRAHDAVEDASEWLSDRRSPIEKAQAEQAEKRKAEAEAKAGAQQVETAFAVWRRMRVVGQEVPEDIQRKAADDILTAAERLEDRHIPVDVDDPAEAYRICKTESDRLDADIEQSIEEQAANPDAARDAAHDEARKNLARTAGASLDDLSTEEILRLAEEEEQRQEGVRGFKAGPSKEDLKGLETADLPARIAALARILGGSTLTDEEARFAVEVALEDDYVLGSVARGEMGAATQRQILDRGGVELLEALNRRTVAIEQAAEDARAKEARAEAMQARLDAKKAAAARTMKVMGPVKSKATGMGDNDMSKLFDLVADTPLPLRIVEDLIDLRDGLVSEYPHAVGVIDELLRDAREGAVSSLRPTLLVGSPGSGKTSLLRNVAGALSMPVVVYPCASVSDGSFGGTPAQWSTKRPSVPLEAVRQNECANPCIILDELEKTGMSDRNGSLVHALLPMLEVHTARSYFETGLEQNVDLSAVAFVATANSLDGVPAPLLDRFRVVRMPDPGPEHVGDLAKRIIEDLILDRRLDRRWTPPLAPDEVDVVRKAWGGGSLRRLRRAVEATLEARESVLRGRAM